MTRSDRERAYVLGNDPDELARLDRQAVVIGPATRLLLHAAGIGAGMRVLDLGTGLGHVARLAGQMVGRTGTVVGMDQSRDVLEIARERTRAAGAAHVSFVEGDVTRWQTSDRFDAVVGRLVLFHVADPVSVVRHHLQHLRRGGLFVAVDFDLGGARTEPAVSFALEALRWVDEAFAAAGASPRIGARLAMILEQAGVEGVTTFGVQGYLAPHDRAAAALLAGVVRSLAPEIVRRGIATADQLDLPALEDRIAGELRRADAVLLPPTVVGAWGRSGAVV